MPLGDRSHDVEAEARAFHFRPERLEAVEAVEDAPELGAGNADAGVPDPDPGGIRRCARGLHGDLRSAAGILHRVVEEVGDRGSQLVDVAFNHERHRRVRGNDRDRLFGEVMARPRGIDAFLNEPG